jgi:hypothetical protein
MTPASSNPTAWGAAGQDKTSSLPGGIDGLSNAPEIAPAQAQIERNPRAIAAVIKDLNAEYASEAAHIASVYARHFVENMEIGDLWSAEHDMRGAILHLREAAAKFRECQGKPLPARGAVP